MLLALMAGGAWATLRGPGARWIVMPRVRQALGPGARVESIAIHLDGSATLFGLLLPASGVAGTAGQAVHLETCRVSLRRDSAGPVAQLAIDGGVVRVSQDLDSGALNLGSLEVLALEHSPTSTRVRVTLRGLRLEVGEHRGAAYQPLTSLTVDGTLTPADEPGRANFTLLQRAEGARAPLDIQGTITPDGATAELRGLDLQDWPATAIPARVRGVYAQLDLSGELGRTVLVLHEGGRVEGRTILRGVDVSLPFDLEGTMRPTGPLARMRGVEGEIAYDGTGVTARLAGRLEDFPYEADLRYEGTTADAPFTCTLRTRGYHLTREAPLLPYAPDVVAERLRTFTQPTGILDADVLVERRNRPDGGPGPVDVSGTIDVRDAVASFINFPYEFRSMRGRFRFDNSVVLVESIEGIAPSGARLFASGEIAPPVDDGRVDLHVRVEDVPLDDTLRAGLRGRARLYDALFSDARLRELADAGLLPADGPGAYVPGGTCDVDVYVTRELGGDSIWDYLVGVRVPEADLLPERFPYPVLARDVVLRIDPRSAEVLRGSFFGLHGGEASVGALADLDASSEVALHVIGHDFPVDDLLIHAAATATDHEPAEWTRIARELGLSGRADPEIYVSVGDDESIRLSGMVEGQGLAAAPGPGSPSLAFAGGLDLATMQADIAGRIDPPAGAPEVESPPSDRLSPLLSTFAATFSFADEATSVDATITNLDLALAIEDLLRPVAPEAAHEVESLRSDIDPRGHADVRALVTLAEPAARADVVLAPRDSLSIDSDFGRVALEAPQGQLRLAEGTLEVQSLAGRLIVDGRPAAWISLDGALRGEDAGISAQAREIDLAHPAWIDIARLSAGDETAATLGELSLRGEASGSLVVAPGGQGGWEVRSASLRPSWVTLARRGVDVALTAMRGGIDYAPGEPLAFTVHGQSPGGEWRLDAGGSAWLNEQPARVQAALEVEADALSPDLRALLPQSVDAALASVNLHASGVRLDLPALELSWTDAGEQTRARGVARFAEARFDVGIEVAQAEGLAAFVVEPGTPPEVRLELTHARAAGVTLDRTRARIVRNDGGTNAAFEADSHAGRISGEARLFDDDRYEADVKFAGLRFGPVLRDLEAQPAAQEPNGADTGEDAPEPASAAPSEPSEADIAALERADALTGRISGELSLTGTLGDAGSRRGRGRLLVGEGRVLDMPLVLPLLKVGNLQLPTRGTIDLALASFYVDGPVVTFDELSAFADSVEIFGYGTMTLPERELDLWFNSRALRPIPIVSRVVESLRRGLVTARVTGPLGRQRVSTDALPGTRAFLDRLFSGPASPQARHLARIEARSRENRDRVRRAGERVRRLTEASPTEGTPP